MANPLSLTFDAADPERLGTFWCLALGYIERPPPEGYRSWAEYDAANGTPGNEAGYAILDPDGKGPGIFFQPVPEPKTAKNRLHIDVRVSGDAADAEDKRQARIEAAVALLVDAGATMERQSGDPDDFFIVMRDPEGNEFCLV
jgi:catechol 2,3-dioxygenase-like lactoylglutathione lyase family enzyme